LSDKAKTIWTRPTAASRPDECCGLGTTLIITGAKFRRIKIEETPAAINKEIHEAKFGSRQRAVAGMKTAREYP